MGARQGNSVAERIRRRLTDLALVGGEPSGGNTRLVYTEEERAAHSLFADWVEEDGGRCVVDGAGNSIGICREGSPYFLLGSHLDTVPKGGGFDGAAGVVAGLEVARVLSDLDHGVRVAAWVGEEGARFGRPCLGSAMATGVMSPRSLERLDDADGVRMVDAARSLGFELATPDVWIDDSVACYFEIHIEQGRLLEESGTKLGLVSAVAGSVRMRVALSGRADHSGATPMRMRTDALAAAAELIATVERVGRSYRSTVATVGRIENLPNNLTTVPELVRLSIDVRDVDAEVQRRAARTIVEAAHEIAERRGAGIDLELVADTPPVMLTAWPRLLAHEECERRGVSYRVMPSGAGHDAALVARRAPSGMVFVPCRDGLSHSPLEWADPADLALASELTAATIRQADPLVAERPAARR